MYYPIRPATQPSMLTRYQSNTAGMVDSDVCIVTIQRTTVKIRDVMATSMTSLVINLGGTTNWFASYLDVNLNSVQNPEKMKPKTISTWTRVHIPASSTAFALSHNGTVQQVSNRGNSRHTFVTSHLIEASNDLLESSTEELETVLADYTLSQLLTIWMDAPLVHIPLCG